MYSMYQGCLFSSSCSSLFAICFFSSAFVFFRLCDVSIIVVFPLKTGCCYSSATTFNATLASLQRLQSYQLAGPRNIVARRTKASVLLGWQVVSKAFTAMVSSFVLSLRPVPFFVGKQCGWLLRKLWCFRTSKSSPHDQKIARRKHEDTIRMESSQWFCS